MIKKTLEYFFWWGVFGLAVGALLGDSLDMKIEDKMHELRKSVKP